MKIKITSFHFTSLTPTLEFTIVFFCDSDEINGATFAATYDQGLAGR